MTRCTEHVRRRGTCSCDLCALPIQAGDRYRVFVAIGDEFAASAFVTQRAHRYCAQEVERRDGAGDWAVHDSTRPQFDDESLRYVRERYGLRVHAGDRVTWRCSAGSKEPPADGVVVRGDNYVRVRFDGQRHDTPCHPSDLVLEAL